MKSSELIKLVKNVCSEGLGKELLNELEAEVGSPNLFDENVNKQYWRIGQVDLIRRLRYFANMPQEELENMERTEKQIEEERFQKLSTNEFGDPVL